MPQFIYTMKGLGKVHPPDTRVLDDIWLSFYFGAKIGVLGLNGAGKSSLLKIMSGEDTQLHRRGVSRPTASRSAFCTRSRSSIPRRPCSATSRKASRRSRRCSTRYDEVNAKLGEDLSPDEMDKVLDEQAQASRTRSTRPTPGISIRGSSSRWTRCGCRRRTPTSTTAVGRRAAPRRALPAAAAVAGPAAARRADQPPRRRVGRLARAVSQGLRRHGRRGDARSLLSRQRRRLDSRARSRTRHSVGGQLLVVARAEAEPPGAGREGRDPAPADARARARMDPHVAARAAGEGQGASQRVRRAAAARTPRRRSRRPKSTSPRARGSATSSSRRAG